MKKPRSSRGKRGFSLVELVAGLLLMGIVGGIWGMGMVQVVEGFLHSSRNAEMFMDGQMAMARIVKELRMASRLGTDPLPAENAIAFVRTDDGRDTPIRIRHDVASDTVKLNDEVLVDSVRRFFLTYSETYRDDTRMAPGPTIDMVPDIRLVSVRLDLNGPRDTVARFETRVFLRGLR
jgi:prepilin-type N-terminal cleavage/methylation domain-containing protein